MASSSSSSSTPAKSKPLHNFDLPPQLTWSKDGKPSGFNKRCRSMNSPPKRPNAAASVSTIRRSPPRDSFAPLRDSFAPPRDSFAPLPRWSPPRSLRESSPPLFRFPHPYLRSPPRLFQSLRELSPPLSRLHHPYRRSPPRFHQSLREPSPPFSRLHHPLRWSSSQSHQSFRDSSPPLSRFPLRGFAAPPPRFPSLIRERTPPQPWFQPEPYRNYTAAPPPRHQSPIHGDYSSKNPIGDSHPPSAIDAEFERLSLLREESLRSFRGRDWWSESSDNLGKGKAPVIAYRRNPLKKSGFSARVNLSSSITDDAKLPKKPKADGGDEVGVSGRSPLTKPSLVSSSPANLPSSITEDGKLPKKPNSVAGGGEVDVCGGNPLKKTSSSSLKEGNKRPTAEEVDPNPKNPIIKKSAASPSPAKKRATLSDSKDNNLSTKSKEQEADPSPIIPIKPTQESKTGPKKSPMTVKIGGKKNKSQEVENPKKAPVKTIDEEGNSGKKQKETKVDDESEEIKVWNLRPRNGKNKPKANGGGQKGSTSASDKNKTQAQPKRSGGGEKNEKKKLSINISLTKEEIEEDIFALTGAKPSRRPKKHPKNVQKQLDAVFPGLWLLSITADSYKV